MDFSMRMTFTNPNEQIARIPEIIQWGQSTRGWEAWRRAYREFVADRFVEVTGRLDSAERALIEGGLSLLSTAQRDRIFSSPWVTDGLVRRHGPICDFAFFSRAILAEADPAQASCSIDEPLATALGDVVYHAGEKICDSRSLAAPLGFPVDINSGRRLPYMDGCGNEIATYDTSAAESVTEKIGMALGYIRSAVPICEELVVDHTEVLMLRSELEEPDRFRSGTFDRYIGLVSLRNAHLDAASPQRLADALVHESIHNMLFVCEVVTKPFWDDANAVGQRVVSPWTGASLALPSFLHACFVWYGLCHFWTRVLDAKTEPALSDGEAEWLRARALRGFRECNLAEVLMPFRPVLDDCVLDVALGLQRSIGSSALHSLSI